MNLKILLLILTSVGMSAAAQITLKFGMSSPRVQEAMALPTTSGWDAFWTVALNPFVVLGMFTYAAGAGVWLLVLARVDVSLAYPFVGIGFILTMVLGALMLGETVGPLRVAGTLLVVAGVALLAHS